MNKSSSPSKTVKSANKGTGLDTDNLISPQEILYMIRERWMLGMALGIILAAAYAFNGLQKEPMYAAQASILVEVSQERVVNMDQVVDNSADTNESGLANHLERMNSRSFAVRVKDSLSEEEIELITKAYQNPEVASPINPLGIIRGAVHVSRNRGTQKFIVRAKHRTPNAAKLLANRFASEYLGFLMDRSGTTNEDALSFLELQARELRQQVQDSERALQQYRKENNLVSLEESKSIVSSRLQSLSDKVTEARLQAHNLKSTLDQIESTRDAGKDLIEIPAISQFGNVGQIRAQILSLQAERAQLAERYLRRYPAMVENQKKIDVLKEQYEQNISLAIADLTNRYQEAQTILDRLMSELNNAQNEALQIDQMAIDYNVLQRQADTDRSTYDQIIERLNEARISSQLDNINIRILDPAERPYAPYEPNQRKIIMAAGLLFLFGFVALPVGLEFLDNRLRTVSEVEKYLRKELIGNYPHIKKLKGNALSKVTLDRSDEVLVESFNAIYSQVQLSTKDRPHNTTLITSTLPSEGKSFMASNLSAVHARHGIRTILVDMDLRRPTQHKSYDLDNKAGVLRWMDQGAQFESADTLISDQNLGITEIGENLWLLRAGGSTQRPTESIGSENFDRLMSRLKTEFDHVIIDSPPAALFPDVFFLAEQADITLYICKHNQIPRQKVKFCVDKLEQTHAPVCGIIFNEVTKQSIMRGHGGQSYSYQYGAYRKAYAKYYAEKE